MIIKIYKITNLLNGKIYIGQTRMCNYNWKRYYGGGLLISKAVKKYGKENFAKEILLECDCQEDANEAEQFYISEFNSTDKKIGYNILYGGNNIGGEKHPSYGKHLSVETKIKIGSANKNNQSFLGKKHTLVSKKRIRKTLLLKFTKKQRVERSIKASMSGTFEQRIERAKSSWNGLTDEQKSVRAGKAWKNFTPEQRSDIAKNIWKIRRERQQCLKNI